MLSRLSVMKTHGVLEHVRDRERTTKHTPTYARDSLVLARVRIVAHLVNPLRLPGLLLARVPPSFSSTSSAKRFPMLSTRYEACLITRSVHVQSNCLPVGDRRRHYRDRARRESSHPFPSTLTAGTARRISRTASLGALTSDRPIGADLAFVLHEKI